LLLARVLGAGAIPALVRSRAVISTRRALPRIRTDMTPYSGTALSSVSGALNPPHTSIRRRTNRQGD